MSRLMSTYQLTAYLPCSSLEQYILKPGTTQVCLISDSSILMVETNIMFLYKWGLIKLVTCIIEGQFCYRGSEWSGLC